MIRVGINGYGTIGKRVADALMLQDDMELVGVTKTKPDFTAMQANKKGIPLYAAVDEKKKDFEKAGVKIEGSVKDLFSKVDIIIDGTPGKDPDMSKFYKNEYEKANVKAIWQGGEKHELTGFSFNAVWNYDDAKDKKFARVVSCNTTGLCRSIKKAKEKRCKLILSYHNFNETPSDDSLDDVIRNAFASGASVAKVAVMPKTLEDTLRTVKIVNKYRSEGKSIVGIAMEEMGKITRLPWNSLGNEFTYVSIDNKPVFGQLTLEQAVELKKILNG